MRRLLDSPWLYFGLAGLVLVVAVASQFKLNLPKRPVGTVADFQTLKDRDDLNVVFILIDTLRADRLSAYGYERETSPIMAALASSGVRFAHVQSQSSWTKSSMASLWTSVYPRRIGLLRHNDVIAEQARMPAEVMSEHGFRTAGVYRNGWVEANFGFAQGFDLYLRPRTGLSPEKFERRNPSAHPLQGTDLDATESAMEFLRSNANDRFFLYVHFMDVHQYLYDDEAAKFGTTLSDAYDNAILWVDRNVSALVGELQQLDLMSRTLVVIASDHGESFYEHGEEGHARTLYREVTETPLIFVPPFRIDGGLVVEHTVQNVDIWPTIYDLLGFDPTEGVDGRSVLPYIVEAGGGTSDGILPPDRPTFSELDRSWGKGLAPRLVVAIVDGPHRMLLHDYEPRRLELYDRSQDPLEVRNIADTDEAVAARLEEKLKAHLAVEELWEAPEVELDEMRKNQLRALGYIDLE